MYGSPHCCVTSPVDLLKQSYLSLERNSAPGIDGVTWQAYGENLEEKLTDLHDRMHKGSYRARPARRTYIAKAQPCLSNTCAFLILPARRGCVV